MAGKVRHGASDRPRALLARREAICDGTGLEMLPVMLLRVRGAVQTSQLLVARHYVGERVELFELRKDM